MSTDPNASPVAGASPVASTNPGNISSLESDLDATSASYQPAIEQSQAQAATDESKAVAASEQASNEAERTANWLAAPDAKMQQWIDNTPTAQASYATAMHAAAPLSILVALGGALTKKGSMNLLSATTGVVQGLNQAAQTNYDSAYKQWMAGYQGLKEQHDRLMQAHELMLKAYEGRADAYQKAADAARRQTGDILDQRQKAINEKIDLFKAQTTAMNQLERVAIAKQALNDKRKAAAEASSSDIRAIQAALQDKGFTAPRNKTFVDTLRGEREAHPDDTPEQIADRIVTGKKQLTADTKEASVAAGKAGAIGATENEIIATAPLAQEASLKVPRGAFVPYNEIRQRGLEKVSDPDMKRLAGYTRSILNQYDALGQRGGSDAAKREENRKNLETADSPQAYKVALDVIQKEAQIAKTGARQAVSDAVRGNTSVDAPAAKTVVGYGVSQSTGKKWVKYSDGTTAPAPQ